ncbi:hypothetical protein MMC10_008575 [Thelotrema lepadinum]|nr:hypothetical protein [Thelotrema lepadinum]
MALSSLVCFLCMSFVTAIPYSQYILAPLTRTVSPKAVHQINGTASGAENLLSGGSGSASIGSNGSVALDFGKNIAGVASMNIGSQGSSSVALTYSESSLWINGEACDGTADAGLDAPYFINSTGPGTYTVDREYERGGFRYLSLINHGDSSVELSNLTVNFTAMPHFQELGAYSGYFHSNDEKVNRVWYAGAYTNELCTIDPTHGDSLVHLGEINSTQDISLPTTDTWYLNTTVANGSSVLTDGAKRDRLVWPGDMSISAPGILVSTNDMVTIKNSLDSLLILQNATTGQLPYAGTPFGQRFQQLQGTAGFSFTYHLYSLIGMSYYYTFTGDAAYIQNHWSNFTKALNFSLNAIDNSGLMNVTSPADWLRFGMGGHNIEANAILYYTIQLGIMLSQDVMNDTFLANIWANKGESIKTAANNLLWNSTAGYYHDNETTLLAPQDGNVWAIKSNLTQNSSQITSISDFLRSRWGPYGAPAPEADQTVSPFISSFEVESHFLASSPQKALDLIRTMWADFMLDDPRMTNSTFIEGYSTDGSLHYAPYTNDPRVSHAHGWATGPTSLLTFYAAGIHLESAMGKTWRIAPQVGDLESVEAGFETGLGMFTTNVSASGGVVMELGFETPEGTSGSLELAGLGVGMVSVSGPGKNQSVQTAGGDWSMDGMEGGNWTITFTSSGNGTQPFATGGAGGMRQAAEAW